MKVIFRVFLVVLATVFTLSTRTFAPDAAADYKAKCASCHKPLSGNAYKVQLARVAVKRAILKAAGGAV